MATRQPTTSSAASTESHTILTVIPSELHKLKQWVPCYPPDPRNPRALVKRPIGGPKSDNQQALPALLPSLLPGQLFGICLTRADGLVGIDVDNLPFAPSAEDVKAAAPQIYQLLQKHPTYVELSPSGKGLHIWYKTDKQAPALAQKSAQSHSNFPGSIFLHSQFITFTGQVHDELSSTTSASASPAPLAELDAHTLVEWLFPVDVPPTAPHDHDHHDPTIEAFQNVIPIRPEVASPSPLVRPSEAIKMDYMRELLARIPPTLSASALKPKFDQIYAGFTPPIHDVSDYEHWRIIIAAIHANSALAGQVELGSRIADEWSAQDGDNYPGQDEVVHKYYSNPPQQSGITHRTLLALAAATRPDWPAPLIVKGAITTQPNPAILENFETLLAHYNLTLHENSITKELSVTGNTYLIDRFLKQISSKEDFTISVMKLCQHEFFKVEPRRLTIFAQAWYKLRTQYNPIKRWIDTASPWNPKTDPSYFDKLFDTLKIPDYEQQHKNLFYLYLKKSLMGVIRAHYYDGPFSATTGIVILQGAENTFKSTWVKQLLPMELRRYILCSAQTIGKNNNPKEIQLEAGTCQIWVRDEVEALLVGGDAALKNLLIQETDAYRPVYGTQVITTPRKCIFFGTTNLSRLPITDDGSRRIQIIPIEMCDTKAQQDIPMDRLFQELLYEFKQLPPSRQHEAWTLTPEEIAETNRVNSAERKADQDIDTALKEVFAFELPFDLKWYNRRNSLNRDKLMTTKDIINVLNLYIPGRYSFSAVKHALKRQCGFWTDTITPTNYGVWRVRNGHAEYITIKGRVSVSGWIVPPIKANLTIDEEGNYLYPDSPEDPEP